MKTDSKNIITTKYLSILKNTEKVYTIILNDLLFHKDYDIFKIKLENFLAEHIDYKHKNIKVIIDGNEILTTLNLLLINLILMKPLRVFNYQTS
ncbi:MAG TPA: hypothetical protein P5513_06745, partial [Candidatus Diapherotrites archaeon]|nr:hypothetical protein [Candidatus Diapherotrites archaeon]